MLIVLLLLAGAISSNAQNQGGPRPRRSPEESTKMQLERLPQTLNLTEDQKAKVSAIYLTQAKSRDSLFTAMGQGTDREVMRTKFTELSALTDKQVLVLLNEDQKKAYNTYIQERASRSMGGDRRPPGNK